jgi:hypothetical protein
LWSTADQIFSVGSADPIEQSILLANYLLFLGYEAFVCFGSSVLEGSTCFVAFHTKNEFDEPKKGWKGSIAFLNSKNGAIEPKVNFCQPRTGTIFNLESKTIPISEIHYVFNHENVTSINIALG